MIQKREPRPLRSEPEEEYVGYKRPPKAHRFKKGQSGNPKGRTKKSVDMKTLVQKHYGKNISIKVDGQPVSVSTFDALIMRILQQGLAGQQASLIKALTLGERYMIENDGPEPEWDFDALNDKELDVFEALLEKITVIE